MSTTFDPTSDFSAVTDGLETVTLRRRGNGENIAISGALRRGLSQTEAVASNGKYLSSDVRWHVAADQLSSAPELGDHIVDSDGNNYTIIELKHQTVSSRWLAVSRNLAIAQALCERIDIQLAVVTQGPAGEELIEWQEFLPGIRARVQPAVAQVHDEDDRRTTRITHTIFVDEPLDVGAQHRVVGANGQVYRIVDVRQQEQIGALAEIHVFADRSTVN